MDSEKGLYYTRIVSAEVMKELRVAEGHKSQYAFEEHAGLTKGQYGRHERGFNATPKTLIPILKHLNTDIGQYYTTVAQRVNKKLDDDKKRKEDENGKK